MEKKYIELIRTVPDFPVKGINFFDWMPVMGCPDALSMLIDDMLELVKGGNFTKVAALESRGYLLGLPMAERLGIGFVPVRKQGKLPGKCLRQEYLLEYGSDAIEIQEDAIRNDDRVLIVDDLLATGGTMNAANELIARITPNITDAFFIELTDIGGGQKLKYPYCSLLKMEEK